MPTITPKYLKSVSTSDSKKIMQIVEETLNKDTNKSLDLVEKIIDQLN